MATGGAEASGVNGVKEQAANAEHDDYIAKAQQEEEKAAKEFQEQCAKEMRAKIDEISLGFKLNTEAKLHNFESRYGDHQTEITKLRQTDVLRLNKITRDVSRELGSDWKSVFEFIMAGTDKQTIEAEVRKIEREKPFLQAYKAIMRWRDLGSSCGVDVEKLIEALQVYGKNELADHVKAILYSEGEELLTVGKVGTGIEGGAASAGAASGGDAASGAAAARLAPRSTQEDTSGHLADRKLLQLAKKIGPSWFELAQLLGLSEEEVEEVKGNEDATYQGAFRVMWLWRDRTLDEDIDQKQVLAEALRTCSMADVAELV